MREQISLNGTWQLKGTASYVPLRDKSMETGKPLEGVTGWMDAQVPGGVARPRGSRSRSPCRASAIWRTRLPPQSPGRRTRAAYA